MKRNIFIIIAIAFSILLFSNCTNGDIDSCQNSRKSKIDTTQKTTFITQAVPLSRAVFSDYTVNTGANVIWQPGDKIWVYKSESEREGSIGSNIVGLATHAKFYFPAGLNNATYKVNYLGHTSITDGRYATISVTQPQVVPNNTEHLQYAGDCAEAIATRNSNKAGIYNMTFRHLPTYLCILPYCNNEAIREGAKITRIVIRSDNAITGKFDVGAHGLDMTYATNTSNNIDCLLANGNGFLLDNSQPNQGKNAIFCVIAPGTHKLSIDYYYSSTQMSSPVKLTKEITSREYPSNTITYISANLNIVGYNVKYYMWDAKQHIWYNRLQPDDWTPIDYTDYPKNNSDLRWFNEINTFPPQTAETELFKKFPTVNELLWYLFKGDAHEEKQTIYVNGYMRTLYGIWLKKKAIICRDEGITEEQMKNGYPKNNPVDWRNNWWTPGLAFPGFTFVHPKTTPVPNTKDYFFLPAFGAYAWANPCLLNGLGTYGCYWSSNGVRYAHYSARLFFDKYGSSPGSMKVDFIYRTEGYPARVFE
ncbi:hypothetical protein [Segatella oulorum]|jgi:hypothetical protein|uniref:hypothetical protein n=1 Tax=Segatella oulorum TaxID=28136 RepID=UPI0028EED333|nr:hypothetical protein [Segatella oulorum]